MRSFKVVVRCLLMDYFAAGMAEALAASTVKIKGNDVLATWKVLVALAGAPTLYSIYAAGATFLAFKYEMSTRYKLYAPIVTMAGLPLIGYSALKFGEVGVDVYKFVSFFSSSSHFPVAYVA